jgi:hypothetical protein
MQSLQGLAVTNGRIGVMGDLALALCQASPDFEDYHEEWLGTEGADDWGCRITVKRRAQSPKVGQFTVHDAKKARLWEKRGKDGAATPWITYPQRMLRYRALGFVLRDAFPDVLKGVKTVEELQDYPNEEPKSGFNHAKPVEGNAVEGEPKQPESLPAPPAATSNGNDYTNKAPAATSEGQTITGMVERAWPNSYQGKTYYFAKVNGQQLQTTDPEVGEALMSQIGKEIRAQVDPSPKPGRFYLKSFQPIQPTASEPIRTAIENPGNLVGVARQKACEAAKQRHAAKGVKAKPTDAEDTVPRGDRTPYDEVCERLASTRPALPEFFLLKAAKRLGWIQESTHRLADMDANGLGVLLVRWTDLVREARAEEHGAAETAAN